MINGHSYVTYFDSGYLARGISLIESLREHGDLSVVWVLCLDSETYSFINDLQDSSINALTISDIEAFEPRLLRVKDSRSRMEYYFTCTPLLLKYVQENSPLGHVAIYLDADLFFFQSPEEVLLSLGSGSVGIIEHRYPRSLVKRLSKYGTFNVGWLAFRKDESGSFCLNWYAEKCLDWCFDTPEPGRYADQGYLDSFPSLTTGVVSIPNIGMNLAPWNSRGHHVTSDSQIKSAPLIDGITPLTFFHFHGIKPRGKWFVTSQLVYYSPMHKSIKELIYKPYITTLERNTKRVSLSFQMKKMKAGSRGKGFRGFLFSVQRLLLDFISITSGNAIRSNSHQL